MIFAVTLLVAVSIAFDFFLQRRCQDIFFSVVHASQSLLREQNFVGLVNAFADTASHEPLIANIALYDGDFHTLAQSGKTRFLPFALSSTPPRTTMYHCGFLKYAVVYPLPHSPDLLLVAWFDAQANAPLLILVYLLSLLVYGFIIFYCTKVDYDSYNAKTMRRSVEFLSLGFHEMKQFVAYTGEIIKYLKDDKPGDTAIEHALIRDYHHLSISVESMMSVIYFTDNRDKFSHSIDSRGKASLVSVKNAIEACVLCYQKRGISIEMIFEHKAQLQIMQSAFYAIVGNIIKNAFCYSNRLVWIITRESADGLHVTVANTGEEISEQKQREILQPKIIPQGRMGLGLLIANLWCQKLEASIEVKSGKMGTEFTVTFPRTWVVAALIEIAPEVVVEEKAVSLPTSPSPRENKRIAIIDDIETFCLGLSKELQKHGYLTATYSCLESFLDGIRHHGEVFHSVIVDRHGVGFDAVKDRFPEACRFYQFTGKIVLFSSNVESYLIDEYLALGFDWVVQKSSAVDWVQVIES